MSADVPQTASSVEPGGIGDTVTRAGARILRGSVWQTTASLTPYILTTFVSIVAARVLGPDRMGRQSYIAFIVLTTMTFCSAGFPAAVPRYIGELIGRGEQGKLPSLVAWAWRIELVAATIGAGVLIVIAALGATPRAAWLFGAVVVFTGVLHKVPGTVLIGAQRWKQNAVVSLSTGAAAAAATIIVLLLGGGITGIFAVLAAANVVMLLWATLLARRLLSGVGQARVPLGAVAGQILRFAAIASVPMVLSFLVFQRSEFFFLEHYSSNTQIALYSIAFSAYIALVALPGTLGNMMAPAVAALFGAGEHERVRSGYARGLRLVLFVAIPVTAGALAFGPTLLRLLYGHQYRGAGTILLILLAPLPLVPLGGLSNGVLVGLARIRVPVIVSIVAGVVDLGLAALLIPHLEAMGAAIANISAQLAGAVITLVYTIRLVGNVDLAPRHLAKIVAAATVAGGSARLLLLVDESAGLLVLAVCLGIAIFVALALWLRVLPRDDADWLIGSLGGRAKGRVNWICEHLSGAPLGAT